MDIEENYPPPMTDVDTFGFYSITESNFIGLQSAVEHGAHLESLLTTAIRTNQMAMVDYLIQCGARVYPGDFLHPMNDSTRALLQDALKYQV
jgi:hypothetical protein